MTFSAAAAERFFKVLGDDSRLRILQALHDSERSVSEILERTAARAPIHCLIGLEDVGAVAAFLVGDWARSLTGSTTYVDGGYHILG